MFRFNRWASRSRGKLFYRLLQQAAVSTPPHRLKLSWGMAAANPALCAYPIGGQVYFKASGLSANAGQYQLFT